jgi:hypothetical protein
MSLFIPKEDEIQIYNLLGTFLKAGFIIDYRNGRRIKSLDLFDGKSLCKISFSLINRHLKLYEKRAASEISTRNQTNNLQKIKIFVIPVR